MTAVREDVPLPPLPSGREKFPWLVCALFALPMLLAYPHAEGTGAYHAGQVVGAALLPLFVTAVAFRVGRRPAAIAAAIIMTLLTSMTALSQTGKLDRVMRNFEGELRAKAATMVRVVDEFEDAGGLAVKGLDSATGMAQRQKLARGALDELMVMAAWTRGERLRERLLEAGLSAARAQSAVAEWAATPAIRDDRLLLEAQRDTFLGVDRLLTVLATEQAHWQAPADGSVLECEFTASAPASFVDSAQQAIATIRDGDERRRQCLQRIEKQTGR